MAINLIHVAKIFSPSKNWSWLLLKNKGEQGLLWFIQRPSEEEKATEIGGKNTEIAMAHARRKWKNYAFTTLKCGFRFTLPERDEIGSNALFHQMYSSYTLSNGIYFDEELGHPCIVRDASLEALTFMKALPNI